MDNDPSKRTYAFCFTHNNYIEKDIEEYLALDLKYILFSKEIGESGTPHLQGYLYTNKLMTIKSMQKMKKSSYRVARGSAAQNHSYIVGPYMDDDGKFKEYNPEHYEKGIRPKSQKEKGDEEIKRWDLAKKECKIWKSRRYSIRYIYAILQDNKRD